MGLDLLFKFGVSECGLFEARINRTLAPIGMDMALLVFTQAGIEAPDEHSVRDRFATIEAVHFFTFFASFAANLWWGASGCSRQF
jgi:hypothetical protein